MNFKCRLLSTLFITLCIVSVGSTAQVPGNTAQTLKIDDAVNLALERNLSITLAQSNVQTAGAHIASSFGAFLPQVSLSGGYAKPLATGEVVIQGTPIPGSQREATYNANASASLLLFDGFSRTATYSGAQSSYNAALESLNQTRQDITFQTRSAFLTALRTNQIVDVRKNDLDLNREQLVRARGLVEAGTAQIGTVYSQEAEVANAELALEQASTDALVARNALEQLLNLDPANDIQLSSEGLANSVDSNDVAQARTRLGSVNELFQKQVGTRGDIQAAQLRVDAARSAISASKSGYYPSLSASLGYNWQKSGSFTSDGTTFGLNVQYTPFDGFRTSEQVQLAEAQYQTAQIELRRLEVQLHTDLQQSLARLDGAERQLRAADKAVAAARQNRYAANERYKVGVGSYTDYLLANSQYLNAQLNQVNAVFNYRLSLYEVQYQAGE